MVRKSYDNKVDTEGHIWGTWAGSTGLDLSWQSATANQRHFEPSCLQIPASRRSGLFEFLMLATADHYACISRLSQ